MESDPKFARAFAAMLAYQVTALWTRIVRYSALTGSRALDRGISRNVGALARRPHRQRHAAKMILGMIERRR